jgi:DNA repair protein RadC
MRKNPLNKFMEASGINTAFMVKALEEYAKQVIADESDWGNSIVSKEAWQQSAQESLEVTKQWRK